MNFIYKKKNITDEKIVQLESIYQKYKLLLFLVINVLCLRIFVNNTMQIQSIFIFALSLFISYQTVSYIGELFKFANKTKMISSILKFPFDSIDFKKMEISYFFKENAEKETYAILISENNEKYYVLDTIKNTNKNTKGKIYIPAYKLLNYSLKIKESINVICIVKCFNDPIKESYITKKDFDTENFIYQPIKL